MIATSTLADLAITHPAAARVFYRHGLDFCCGGRRPLADVCAERGIDPNAVLAAIEELMLHIHLENNVLFRRALGDMSY